jgi:hypothetical protein
MGDTFRGICPGCKIASIMEQNQDSKLKSEPVVLSPASEQTDAAAQRAWLPWTIAGGVILLGLIALIVFNGRHEAPPQPGGAQLAQPDPYAANLVITHVKMSEAANFAGGKVTYIDGEITNSGTKTLTGVTVQIGFHNELGELSQKETMPINLIRTREPYVDTQPVSAAPIEPGQEREFRLILDHVTMDWNQQYPEIRVVEVKAK